MSEIPQYIDCGKTEARYLPATEAEPSNKNLYAALSKAQAQMDNVAKTSDNPFFKSKYASLDAVWTAIRKPLTSNGLCVIQFASTSLGEHAYISVRTRLAHLSGEFVEATLDMEPSKIDPQGMGSAIKYARRYGLMAIVGLADEDDDGNAASARPIVAAGPDTRPITTQALVPVKRRPPPPAPVEAKP